MKNTAIKLKIACYIGDRVKKPSSPPYIIVRRSQKLAIQCHNFAFWDKRKQFWAVPGRSCNNFLGFNGSNKPPWICPAMFIPFSDFWNQFCKLFRAQDSAKCKIMQNAIWGQMHNLVYYARDKSVGGLDLLRWKIKPSQNWDDRNISLKKSARVRSYYQDRYFPKDT